MSQLEWHEVVSRFTAARNWWVSTSGGGGPHAVPVWGVAQEGVLTFWGSPTTVRSRNLERDPRLVVHLEDGEEPLIVHGTAQARGPAGEDPGLVELFARKYRAVHDEHYRLGSEYAADAVAYAVRPRKALAWRVVAPEDWTVRRWRPSDEAS